MAMASMIYSVDAQSFVDNRKVLQQYAASVDSMLLKTKSISADQAKEALLTPSQTIKLNLQKPRKKALTPAAIYASAKPATVIMATAYLCNHCEHTHVSEASGYVIDPTGIVVTNFHVVRAFVSITEANRGSAFVARLADGRTYPVKSVLTVSEENDLAIVQLDTHGEQLPSLALADKADVGDKAFVLGHPQNMHYVFTQGNVIHKEIEHFDFKQNGSYDRNTMLISADYAVGSSGGPVIDERGNIIGTVSSTKTLTHSEQNPSVQMVLKKTIPVESLWKLLK